MQIKILLYMNTVKTYLPTCREVFVLVLLSVIKESIDFTIWFYIMEINSSGRDGMWKGDRCMWRRKKIPVGIENFPEMRRRGYLCRRKRLWNCWITGCEIVEDKQTKGSPQKSEWKKISAGFLLFQAIIRLSVQIKCVFRKTIRKTHGYR